MLTYEAPFLPGQQQKFPDRPWFDRRLALLLLAVAAAGGCGLLLLDGNGKTVIPQEPGPRRYPPGYRPRQPSGDK